MLIGRCSVPQPLVIVSVVVSGGLSRLIDRHAIEFSLNFYRNQAVNIKTLVNASIPEHNVGPFSSPRTRGCV